MGGASSTHHSNTSTSVQDLNADVGLDHTTDRDSNSQDQQGTWSTISSLSNLHLFRRRQGADLYDDEKASTSLNGDTSTSNISSFHDINKRDTDGHTPLTLALRSEDEDNLITNVSHLLDHPYVDINYPELQQCGLYSYIEVPPLTVATKTRNKNLVELLLEKGASINGLDSNDQTALYYAAEIGDLDILTLLLKYRPRLGSAPNIEDPLHVACRFGYTDIVTRLVEAGAKIHPEKESFLSAPLILAAENKHEDVCIFLLDKMSSHKDIDSVREDVFIRACWFGCPRVVQYLIELGTNLNVLSSYNTTGLVHALRSGDLARYGRELRIAQGEQRLIVISSLRIVLKECVTIINLLCENEVDLELLSGMYQMAPLSLSMKAGNIPAAILLLKHGAIWDGNCDYVFERSNLKRLHNVDPKHFSILLQFLDNKRRSLYKPKNYSNCIRTLKDCCRHVIRSRVRRQRTSSTSILPLLRSLPLPFLIKEFLCYSEIDEVNLVDSFQLSFLPS